MSLRLWAVNSTRDHAITPPPPLPASRPPPRITPHAPSGAERCCPVKHHRVPCPASRPASHLAASTQRRGRRAVNHHPFPTPLPPTRLTPPRQAAPSAAVRRGISESPPRRSCAAGITSRTGTAGCHAGLRHRSQLFRYYSVGAPRALGPRRNALRRRSRAAQRRPEASLGRKFRRASGCWHDGRRSAACRRPGGPLRCGQGRRRRRGLLRPARVLGGSRNTICRLPSRCLRGTLVAGGIGFPPLSARGSARVVAFHPLPHQPPHQLPDRQVRIHVRKQLPQLLQSALALAVDHRLHLPAAVPQRAQPRGRLRLTEGHTLEICSRRSGAPARLSVRSQPAPMLVPAASDKILFCQPRCGYAAATVLKLRQAAQPDRYRPAQVVVAVAIRVWRPDDLRLAARAS